MNNLNNESKSSNVDLPKMSCPSDREEKRRALILAGGDTLPEKTKRRFEFAGEVL